MACWGVGSCYLGARNGARSAGLEYQHSHVICRLEREFMPSNTHQDRLLAIETAKVRHAWAKSQIVHGESTPALLRYLKDSLDELALLKAADSNSPKTV
jgi:hypothetical protein